MKPKILITEALPLIEKEKELLSKYARTLSILKDVTMIGKKLKQIDYNTTPTIKLRKLRFTGDKK